MMYPRLIAGGCGLGLALFLIFARPSFGEYRLEVVLSGSMWPALSPGTLLLVHRLPPKQYQVGDVVTFMVPDRKRELVTHRITSIQPGALSIIQTKGDANTNGDPWRIVAGNILGRVEGKIPGLGYLLYSSRTRVGFLGFTLLFFFGLVWPGIRALWMRKGGDSD